ncbi:family 2A encapsulin nanocompartment cargo protein cysteine desulfurase [Variovorax sp. J22G73]|uniref:family 2A encapsulin nanocompartment cargo protein cysteine desulfurase n=1 Tax=unclassified Variovorax TaxID=663243 RepID=UPI001A9C62B0|nr:MULTISPECIES: family 2A encapsulin nanocompartment cargo protein cysteine desulfurase [unclassified Variovorax]MDM0006377.1 family 2A encapsulin nanocompartment cargo protein cysteine desulfurase [Variovorax sp. J22R203]MDM0097600.1 family 2A encapsulin nanocompartment cargo protein cysteine desulfurase [Variovorax sp. J22G73]
MSSTPSIPGEAPFDPATLARMANAMFAALPGTAPGALTGTPPTSLPGVASGLVPGAQFPANVAPPGSPLVSPAGFGPSVPGTPIPQGQIPGANVLPASPTQLPSLANRAPALLPHAVAGNGVPDTVLSVAPAFEPRLGSSVLGVPQQGNAPVAHSTSQAGASPFYFLNNSYGHPSAGATDAVTIHDPFAGLELPPARPASPVAPQSRPSQPSARAGRDAQFYFVDAVRLPNGFVTPAKADPRGPDAVPQAGGGQHPPFDVNAVRRDFPILQERVNGKQLVWFDNAATTHKPQSVIDRIAYFYAHENSNIHRAAHELAARATDAYEGARERVRKFINAPEVEEVIFVRGTTEAINLVAKSWGGQHVGEGDEIIVSNLEHHANIVPWQQLAAAKGAKLRVIPVDDSGQVLLDEYRKLLNDRTKIVAVTQVSNALGTVVPVKEIVALAHRAGAKALVDGAQSVSHMRVDVQDIGADFFVFSGHKVFGPTGIGVVWGKREVLEDMPPWQGGGNMIADVTFEKTVFQPIPNKFEAGTGNIADAVGLGAAIDYVNKVGIENIARYEHDLLVYGMRQLGAIPGVRLIGTAADKASVMSFVLDGYTTEEVGHALNDEGIAVRTGHHCAQPILRRFGVETTVRPSLAFYNTFDEIDRLVTVVRRLAGQRRAG